MARMKQLCLGIGAAMAASFCLALPAQAQSAQQRVVDLNREAMDAYNNLDINRAGSLLEQALNAAARGGVDASTVARTQLNLGVVYMGGLGDDGNALEYFGKALCTDASIQPDPLTSSPDIQAVFKQAKQKVQSQGCPGGGSVAASTARPAASGLGSGALSHDPPAEQQSQTPLPIYVEVAPDADVGHVYLYYMGLGMSDFKRVEMQAMDDGYGYQIPCQDVWEPQVRYYIAAFGGDGDPLGFTGTQQQPLVVPVVTQRTQPAPAFPGRPAPRSCATSECPPGIDCGAGAGATGAKGLGDTCSRDGDCQSGMSCLDNFCSLGMRGSRKDSSADSGEMPRFFVRMGIAAGFAHVRKGMRADRDPPLGEIYNPPITFNDEGLPVADPNSMHRQNTPWVPDGDSYDAGGNTFSECPGDGQVSHPSGSFEGMDGLSRIPTNYCVNVPTPGFVSNLALRSEIGYWILPRLALQGIFRFQFDSGQGNLAAMLLGGRIEYMFTQPKVTGLMFSGFVGGSIGQIQARPPSNAGSNAPYVISGMQGAHLGFSLRYRLMRNFGLHFTPELDLQFPDFLSNIDTTMGVEVAF